MKKQMTLGSLFDGSGGFPLGGMIAGIEPSWASEIEPFPVLITHKRMPQVRHYGDVSKLSGADLEPVDIITFGSPCFPEGTLILTETGYIPIEEVEVGMKVLTHRGRWKTVTATGAKFGETVVLRGNHYGLECTPNHPIYSSGERKYYPQLGNGKRGNQIILTEDKDWVEAGDMEGRLWAVPNYATPLPIASPVYSGSWRQKTMPPLSEDLFYFVGRWLGDGWVRNGQRSGRPEGQTYGTILLCDSHDKEDELRRIVEKLTDNYSVERGRTGVKFKFNSQVFCEWLTDNFGHYAHGKTMPGWVFGLPESYRCALLKGLTDSDGYRVKGKRDVVKISTVSKSLAESIRLLGEMQGYSTTVHYVRTPDKGVIEGREINQRDYYTVALTKGKKRTHLSDDRHGWYRVRSVTPTYRTKVVYNITVEEDNSYVADGIVVHNCQDLSIAGKRAGIHDGARSNLFFQAIRIIKEMREATNGKYPRYCVWENVPGAFSSNKGEDFRAVLEAVVGIKEEGIEVPAPENHRWPKSDVLLGSGWSVAYRVLDAQYWSVPQRRARIYLVADFAGESAPEVLFESEGMSGYTPQGFRSWQGAAGGSEEGAGAAGGRADDRSGDGRYCLNTQGQSGVTVTEEQSGTLIAQDHGNHPAVMQAAGFSTEHSAQSRSIGYEEEVAPTLRSQAVPAALAVENHPTDGRVKIRDDGQCQTLTERMGTGGGNVPLVAEPEPVTLKIRSGCEGGGKGALWQEDKSATLGTHNDQTLFQPVEKPVGFDRYNSAVTGDVAHTLDTGAGNTKPMVFEPEHKAYGIAKEAYSSGEKANFNFTVTEEKSPTLQTREPHAVAKPEMRAYGVCSKSSHSMLSDNPHSGFYEAKVSRTLDQSGGNAVTSNQGGICIVAPVEENETYDVRFTSDGTKNARGHCYKTDISRCLDTSEQNPDSNHGGVAVVALEPGAASRVGGHVYTDGKSGTLRANAGDNQQAVVAFTQNQRDELRDLKGKSGALAASHGSKQQTYVLQGSMIGRDEKNGPQGSGINEDVSFTLNTADRHAVAFADKTATLSANDGPKGPSSQQLGNPAENFVGEPSVYHSSKNSHHTKFTDEPMTDTLVASDYKDPPTVSVYHSNHASGMNADFSEDGSLRTLAASDYKDPPTVSEEPMYIVRRLTPTECARLQGFPDWWCDGLSIEDPTEEQMAFWTGVWDTWNSINGKKPKTEKQIRKWLADPYTDAAAYKLWGNGVALPCVYFVLSGIAWAAGKDREMEVSE